MASYDECPHCGTGIQALTASYKNLYECNACETLFCFQCGGFNHVCPACGSDDTQDSGHDVTG
jgi:hypothetical protein